MTSPVRSVTVRLGLDPSSYIAGASRAEASTLSLDRAVSKVGPSAATSMERAASGAGTAEGALGKLNKTAGALGFTLGGLAGVGGAVAVGLSIKWAGDYQSALTRLATTAGESQANLKMVGQGMLDMAGKVGIGADELAKGMYTVDSAGIHGADSLTVLKAAAQGARQENADLSHVVDAVTTSLHDYHLPASDAAKVTSQLIAAVSSGKTTFDDLTGAMHSVEPIAASAGMSIAQTAGALAAMTASGVHADQAAQNLASSIRSFEKPTGTMTAELGQLGLNAQDLSAHLGQKGIAGTLQEVSDAIVAHMGPAGQVALSALNQNKQAAQALATMIATMPPALQQLSQGLLDGTTSQMDFRKESMALGGQAGAMADQFLSLYKSSDGFSSILKAGGPAVQTYIGALGKAVGTSEGLSVALQLTGENADGANKAIDAVAKATGDASGNIKGWDEVQGNFNQKLAEAEASAKSLAIEAGQHLLPVLTDALGWVVDHGVPALEDLGHWLGQVAQSTTVQATLHGIADAGHMVWTALHDAAGVVGPLASDLGHLFGSLPGPMQAATLGLLAFNAARKAGWLSVPGSAEAAASAGIVQRSLFAIQGAATQTALVTASSFGRMKAAYAEAATAAQVSAQIQGESMASTRIVGALAGTTAAAKNLAQQGFGAVRSGASGLMSMFGGPWGLALLGATGAVFSITEAIKAQADAERAASQQGADLAHTYASLGTVYGQQADDARQSVASQAEWAKAAQSAGVSSDTLTQALQGNKDAQDKVNSALDTASFRWHGLFNGQFGIGDVLTDNTGKYKDMATAAFGAIDGMTTRWDLFDKSTSAAGSALESVQSDADKVFGKNNLMNQGISTVQKGMDELARAAGDTKSSLQGITDILDGITGKGISAAQAQADLTTALDGVAHSFDNADGAVDTHTKALDLNSKAGADLFHRLQDLGDGYKTSVNDAYNSALATGTATDASKAAGVAAETLYNKFILTATGAGMSEDAAKSLAKQLGLVPGDVVTQFTTPGLNAAQAGVQYLQGQVDVITAFPHDITVRGLTQQAEDALTQVGVHVDHLPDGTVHIGADTYAAQSALDNFLIRNATHVITVGIAGRNDAAYTGSSIIVNGRVVANAAGNLLGMAPMSSSTAQVVKPGTLRVIGDNPVADEAFIPINNSARSLSILGETAARMGLGLHAMANGGFIGIPGPWPAGGTSAHIDINPNALHDKVGATLSAMVNAIKAAQAAAATAPGAPGNVSANAALGQMMASRYGWGSGAEWNSLYALWRRESGWNNNAQNPTSTAYGIPQFLNSTWPSVGFAKTSDPATQIAAGLKYIEQRFRDPIGAWGHEARFGWYHGGGTVQGPDGATVPAFLKVGETVRTAEQEDQVHRALRTREMTGASLGATVVHHTDARSYPLTVQASGDSTGAIVRTVRDAQRDLEFLHG